jgi:hypothetical protein
MITKHLIYIAISLSILLPSCVACRTPKDKLYDIENRPLFYTIGKSFFYVMENGSRIKVPTKPEVEFNGDKDSLRHFMNDIFYGSSL